MTAIRADLFGAACQDFRLRSLAMGTPESIAKETPKSSSGSRSYY